MVCKFQERKDGGRERRERERKEGKKDGRKEGREGGREGGEMLRDIVSNNSMCKVFSHSVTFHSFSNPVSQSCSLFTDKKVRLTIVNDSSKMTKPLKCGAGSRPHVLCLLNPLCVSWAKLLVSRGREALGAQRNSENERQQKNKHRH